MTNEERLQYARENYPVGTKVESLVEMTDYVVGNIYMKDDNICCNDDRVI
jgi:hypothetical protein